MKQIMIKVLVIILGISIYFNISQVYTTKNLDDKINRLETVITQLENIENTDQSCNKVYEISIRVVVEKDDLDVLIIHCTNKSTLGDALDELVSEMEIVFDPNFSKDYIYGRMVHSFYGVGKVFEEYYEINIDGERADYGVDFITLESDTEYSFTLVRWS